MELNQNLCKAVSKYNSSIGRNGFRRAVMNSVVRTTRKMLIAFRLMFSKPLKRICFVRL